ncbi:MAG: Txe/YoeB family addiction module toxin [Prevotellaceae bacterium]|jgi:toxin YoeB|nr:Txe/YoeB family addiction module toxin [Prevotellaceae bacterium]
MEYELIFPKQVEKKIEALKRDEPQVHEKLLKLIAELRKHPEAGTGHVKPLKCNLAGCYSRRITQKHRLIYQINKEEQAVLIIAVGGHYADK